MFSGNGAPDLNALLQQMQGQRAAGSGALVEFKAGRMNFDGKLVKPDRRKGIIRVAKDP